MQWGSTFKIPFIDVHMMVLDNVTEHVFSVVCAESVDQKRPIIWVIFCEGMNSCKLWILMDCLNQLPEFVCNSEADTA